MIRLHISLLVVAGLLLLLVGCAGHQAKSVTAKPEQQDEVAEALSAEGYHHFTNAVIYEQEGMYNDAVGEYQDALAYDPTSYDIRTSLGDLYLRLKRPDDCLSALLPIGEKQVETYMMIGEAYRQLGNSLQAKSAYQQALSLDSTNAEVNYQLSLWAASEGDLQESVDYLKTAAFSSNAPDLFAQIAQTYGGMQEFDSAAVYTRRAIQMGGNSPALVGQLAFHYSTAGMLDSAKVTLLQGVQDFPDEPRLWAQLVEVYDALDQTDSMRITAQKMLDLHTTDHAVYERIGEQLVRRGHMETAENCFKKALEIDPTSPMALFYLGRLAGETNRLDEANNYFELLREAEPDIPDGWLNQALTMVRQGDTTEALNLLDEALYNVRTERSAIRLAMSQMLVQTQQQDSALQILKGMILEGGDTLRALFNIGAIYEQTGRFDKAVESFELLLTIDSTYAQAQNYLGYMFADHNTRLDEALDLIEKAVAQDTTNGAYLDSYAWVLYRLGRYDDALVQIKKATAQITDDPIVTEHLGDIYFALGDVGEAMTAWEKALRLDPDNQELKDKVSAHSQR